MKGNLFQWLVATAGLILLAWHERHGPWPPLRISGALLCLIGFAGVTVARYQLGRSFSVSAQARQLVTTGVYARFSNPIYVFAEVFALGLPLYLRSWPLFGVAIILVPLQIARARKEAKVLEEAFGEDYRRYWATTWL